VARTVADVHFEAGYIPAEASRDAFMQACRAIGEPLLDRRQQAYLCGVAVAVGHCYPITAGFRGGKGVATLAGVFGALMGAALPWMLAGFALVVMLTGYVSLATLMSALIAVLIVTCFSAAGLFSDAGAFTLAMTALVVWKHRDNLRRLTESAGPPPAAPGVPPAPQGDQSTSALTDKVETLTGQLSQANQRSCCV
jgi:hypothetical protein